MSARASVVSNRDDSRIESPLAKLSILRQVLHGGDAHTCMRRWCASVQSMHLCRKCGFGADIWCNETSHPRRIARTIPRYLCVSATRVTLSLGRWQFLSRLNLSLRRNLDVDEKDVDGTCKFLSEKSEIQFIGGWRDPSVFLETNYYWITKSYDIRDRLGVHVIISHLAISVLLLFHARSFSSETLLQF